jgi:hypothetical protein
MSEFEPQVKFPPAVARPGRVVCHGCNGYRVRVHMGGGQVPCETCDDGTVPLDADSIPNSQIRELRALAATRFMTMVQVSRGHWISAEECIRLCDEAMEEILDACAREPMPSRAKCAEILNWKSGAHE